MSKTEKIIVMPNEDLHPKTIRFPFVDKNGVRHSSVAQAFIRVTEGRISNVTVAQIIETLTRIIFTQISQHKEKLGGLIRTTIGMNFELGQKNVDFLPGEPNQGWGFLYGVAINKARKLFLEMANMNDLITSTGPVPHNAQPCLKCGGSGDIAGHGNHLMVTDERYLGGWKYRGICFDCEPRTADGSRAPRGLGYITRGMARSNWIYYHGSANNRVKWDDNHVGIEANLWNPDDSSLWYYSGPVNMKEVVLDVHDSEVPT